MKLTGPIICISVGLLVFGLAWASGFGPTDHNIGRNIANTVIRQGFQIIGGITCLVGAVWLLARWLGKPSE